MNRSFKTSYPMWVISFFIAAVFTLGGGARADIQSVVILRPLAVLCGAIALWGITKEQLVAVRKPLILAAFVPLIMVVQLIPLPPAIWTSLPGREIYVQAAPLAGIEQPWRPISLVPFRTWNSIFAWTVPLAAILLAARLNREQRFALLPVLIALGLLSGVVGLAQAIGSPTGALYFYDITNNGSAVGLFANRNHQAALLACLFPMLAVYASVDHPSAERVQLRTLICGSIALFVLPLLLVTGSRGGLILGIIGLLAGGILYRRPRAVVAKKKSRRSFDLRYVVGGLVIVMLAGVTAMLSRAQAIERLLRRDETEELRLQLLEPIWRMMKDFFPVGTGFGTFPDVYKAYEPFELLTVAYVNHAHNDLLEFVLEGGIAAVAVVLVGCALWVIGVIRLRIGSRGEGRTNLFGRLGAAIILIMAIASIVDYPLRVPSLSVVFAVATMWMAFGLKFPIARRNELEASLNPELKPVEGMGF